MASIKGSTPLSSHGAAVSVSQSYDVVFPSEQCPRLSTTTPTRLLFGSLSSCFVGFVLGAAQGGQMAQLRFRAEHAHKMPYTTAGWYFYHKSKNYHAMQGGIVEGFRMGARTGFWSSLTLTLESTVDRYRGCNDMFSTIVATLSVSGAFSLWHRLTLSATARTAKLGFLFGLTYGGVQDLVGLARGRPIGYVEVLRHRYASALHGEPGAPVMAPEVQRSGEDLLVSLLARLEKKAKADAMRGPSPSRRHLGCR